MAMNEIKPLNYRIHLEPDLQDFRFSGTAEISIEATGPVREIVLNALELDILSCKVTADGVLKDCSWISDSKQELIKVSLPHEMTGKIDLVIEYNGLIENKMAGFYRSRYVSDGKEKYAAVTQFEESDARRAFPCFDHPEKKATFDVEMVVPKALPPFQMDRSSRKGLWGTEGNSSDFKRLPRCPHISFSSGSESLSSWKTRERSWFASPPCRA